ncbi:MAG: hypothetical protein PHY83_03600 [Bacilli bacterium]|nr:hypothetical protein [Bacilli bacterium]MDD3085190.1 hypothetical protein [Candidatus ainarchaeum sp.]
MSIKSFKESSLLLYENDKYLESLCIACIAIDACAAQLYPGESVTNRNKLFLKAYFRIISKYGFPGIQASNIRIKLDANIKNLKKDEYGNVGMEQIIYHVIRCGLVHEATIDGRIQFTNQTIIGDFNSDKFFLPKAIIFGLIKAIDEALIIM